MAKELTGEHEVLRRARAANALGGLYLAEAAGLMLATRPGEAGQFSKDPAVQRAFLRGFADGREMLAIHAAVARKVA